MQLEDVADESIAAQSFPCTTAEFVEAHGDTELQLPNGTATLAEVLEVLPDEELTTPDDARLTTYSVLGEAAIGRKGYSDRDPFCPGEDGHDPVSL